METLRFDGQVALVTGAGRGLGREHALALAARGAHVVVNDIPDADGVDPAGAVAAEITSAGGRATAQTTSLTDDPAAVVDAAVQAGGRLDIVVNNAGISHGGPFDTLEPAMFDRMLDIHLHATVRLLRAAWPHLKATRGRVVNTTSNSLFGVSGSTHYVSAKGGVFGLTRALAKDGRPHGIRVNAVMPIAYTRMTANIPDENFRGLLAKHFTPDKVAPFVVWLAASDVPVTGETFSVGGGHAARVLLGVTPGANADSPEGYTQQLQQLMDPAGHLLPANANDEVAFAADNLGIAGAAEVFRDSWKQ